MGVGGAPPPREAPAAEATAEGPVLPAEAPAAEEAREGERRKRAVCSSNGTSLNPQTCVRLGFFVGDGADAALQPAAGGGDEEQADPGEGASAQDSAQRGQDPHGHVQEEPPNQRRGRHHPRAGARACEAGRDRVS